MDTASLKFVLFGLAVAVVSNLSRSRVWRSVVLFVASLLFIGLIDCNPLSLIPLAGFLLAGYACLRLLQNGWSRFLAWIVVAIIFAYIWLKKYTFLPEGSFLHFPYFTLGLSYIFFRVLHVLIDTGEGGEKQPIGLGAYLLYTLNFTTFVSGPIQRYDEFARDQFAPDPIQLGPRTVGLQLERIIRGFFKVNVLAMFFNALRVESLAQVAQSAATASKLLPALELAVVYPLFLYCNFSGYIDIVIAIARLMRVRLPENFDRPFSACSVLDFWNQWHITLSNWLKTYVYNPLMIALMRRFPSPSVAPALGVFAFFVTFFLIGVWHGRTSEFLMFGLLTGGGISVNKLWQIWLTSALGRKRYKALAQDSAYRTFARGLNFVWFSLTLFWFWSDWKTIGIVFGALSGAQWAAVWLAAWIAMAFVFAFWEWLRSLLLSIRTAEGPALTSRYALTVYASALGLTALVITVLLNQPAPDIVYKAF